MFNLAAVAGFCLALLSVLPTAMGDDLDINVPTDITSCQSVRISWSGGDPPYWVTASGSDTRAEEQLVSNQTSTSAEFFVKHQPKSTVVFVIRDRTGRSENDNADVVGASADLSCLASSPSGTLSSDAARTTSQPATKETANPSPSKKLAPGVIAGIVIGSLVLLLIIVFLCCRRCRKDRIRTAAQLTANHDDNDREGKNSNVYDPLLSSQPRVTMPAALAFSDKGSATPSSRSAEVAPHYAGPPETVASSQYSESTFVTPLGMASQNKEHTIALDYDPSAAYARQQQSLAFEKARDPHFSSAPSGPAAPLAADPIAPPFDPSVDAVRQDQARAFEKIAQASTSGSVEQPYGASTSSTQPPPDPQGAASEGMQRQIEMLRQQVEVLALNQVRSDAEPGVPPAYPGQGQY